MECFTLRGHIYVIGTRANRIATMEMASYLIETVERLANESAAEVPGDERRVQLWRNEQVKRLISRPAVFLTSSDALSVNHDGEATTNIEG
jgi:hypothetical protein